MKTNPTPNSNSPKESNPGEILLVSGVPGAVSELERFAAAYVRFDALMTAQLQELEFRFREYWTPRAKQMEFLGRP